MPVIVKNTNFLVYHFTFIHFCCYFCVFAKFYCTYVLSKDVKQERRHSELIHGLEHFDKEHGLKHAEIHEKVILPNAQGCLFFARALFLFINL